MPTFPSGGGLSIDSGSLPAVGASGGNEAGGFRATAFRDYTSHGDPVPRRAPAPGGGSRPRIERSSHEASDSDGGRGVRPGGFRADRPGGGRQEGRRQGRREGDRHPDRQRLRGQAEG